MVYHGKPSSGCGRCKQRRKKCDETRPKCLNCQRIGHECPGYPDKLDIMFKNETDVVVRRATKRTRHTGRSPSLSISTNSGSVTPSLEWVSSYHVPDPRLSEGVMSKELDALAGACPSEQAPSPEYYRAVDELDRLVCPEGCCLTPLSMTFNPGIEEQVTQFFFSHFQSRAAQKILSRGFVDVLIPKLGSLPVRSPLLMACQAIAMRTVGICHQREELIPRANALYCRAMASIQMSIEDPVLCTHDDTLLAVLLFSMYESIAATSVKNWSDHVHGAVNIIKARGVMRYDEPLPLLLFRATRGNVLTDSLRRSIPMIQLPDSRTWLEAEAVPEGRHALERFTRLAQFRADAQKLFASPLREDTIQEAERLIERVFKLHGEFAQGSDCKHRDCVCITIIHWANNPEEDLVGAAVDANPAPIHVERKMHDAAACRHNEIGLSLSAQTIAQMVRWLKPQTCHTDERFQVATLWIQHTSEATQASRPRYLDFVSRANGQSSKAEVTSETENLNLRQAAHGLCTPPLHWVLMNADSRSRKGSISDLSHLTVSA